MKYIIIMHLDSQTKMINVRSSTKVYSLTMWREETPGGHPKKLATFRTNVDSDKSWCGLVDLRLASNDLSLNPRFLSMKNAI